jgi:hypothetical protein
MKLLLKFMDVSKRRGSLPYKDTKPLGDRIGLAVTCGNTSNTNVEWLCSLGNLRFETKFHQIDKSLGASVQRNVFL